MTRKTYFVVWTAVALALVGCDGWYFRRIDVTGPETAGFALDSASTQAVLLALRDYATQAKLRCTSVDALPFECSRTPVRVWAQQSQHGVAVCYSAHGASFEQKKFQRRIDHLQRLLVERLGARSVTSSQANCPAMAATP